MRASNEGFFGEDGDRARPPMSAPNIAVPTLITAALL
jgi:hypothetical protein